MIANRVRWFLNSHAVRYDLVAHRHTSTSVETARSAHIEPERVAKCVLLHDAQGYWLAVLPASRRIDLGRLMELLGCRLELASEGELGRLLLDCDVGAVPPVGDAYDVRTVLDDSLMEVDPLYFEGGDHEDLVRVSRADFRRLLPRARREAFSQPATRRPGGPLRQRGDVGRGQVDCTRRAGRAFPGPGPADQEVTP
jgi:Ala-tRNA(Pro) deacylase